MGEPSEGVTVWRRPSRCGANGACLEVGAVQGGVDVRDAKRPDGAVLHYSVEEFRAFVAAAKAGEYDDLCQW
jgi:Domain of unknown function (DUF397)